MVIRSWAAIGVLVFLLKTPLDAHHAFAAEFSTNSVTLSGTITKVTWMNPHARFSMTVSLKGAPTTWELVLASPNVLIRQGWDRWTLKQGDHVTVNGYVAKDGSHSAAARIIHTSDGRALLFGSNGDGGPDK